MTAMPSGTPEQKDPSIIQRDDGKFEMFCSIGNSNTQQWINGRFIADSLNGPWQELEPVKIIGECGPEMCAPAVTYDLKNGKPFYTMYVQSACFQPGSVIALCTSTDGEYFTRAAEPLFASEDLHHAGAFGHYGVKQPNPFPLDVMALYDASISKVRWKGKEQLMQTFSGYRRIGCGDIFGSMRPAGSTEADWSKTQLILRQEDISFHNRPDSPDFEWGIEGTQVQQLGPKQFIMTGVCFLDKPRAESGTRQRVFFAAARSPFGPFHEIGMPVEPTHYAEGKGENGHPDTVIDGDTMHLIYQERAGEGQPWHLRHTTFELGKLRELVEEYAPPLELEKNAQIAPRPVTPEAVSQSKNREVRGL